MKTRNLRRRTTSSGGDRCAGFASREARPPRARRGSAWGLPAVVALGIAALAVGIGGGSGGCSLGEGVTANCLNAAPGTENACQEVAACDDGTGRVQPSTPCCLAEATLGFLNCCIPNADGSDCPTAADRRVVSATGDFRAFCGDGTSEGVACCDVARELERTCLERDDVMSAGGAGGAMADGGGGAAGGAGGT
ncbi:MAG: hypothetical protein AAF928_10010 [Myxococcota bacterium]